MTRVEELELSACHREPIHIPGAIQPHGVLLALDVERRVRRAAGNLEALLGWSGNPAGRSIQEIVSIDNRALDLTATRSDYVDTVIVEDRALDLFVHRIGDELIVELEPAPDKRLTGAEVLRDLLPVVTGIAGAADLVEACNIAAAGVRHIVGFDRVMVYRFLEDETGQVIAEAKAGEMDPFLHHRYPASDIPQQARALYIGNPIRLIPDVNYVPAPLVGGEGQLDLSGALLRSVSPVHIQYLKNMAVVASASVSIVREGKLWGLIACHHQSAKFVGHEERQMSCRIAIALEQSISRLDDQDSQREALSLAKRREEFLPTFVTHESMLEGIRNNLEELRSLIPADGIVVLIDDEIICSGISPSRSAAGELAKWVADHPEADTVETAELAKDYAPASAWGEPVAGLLGCVVLREPLIVVLWLRVEEIETVYWAGNPHKPAEPGSSFGQLCPRQSFETWAETVRGRSRRWSENEQKAAQRISLRLAEIGRQKTLAELTRQLSSEVEEKDLLMREMHHRVQNNLQLVTAMLQLDTKDLGQEGARGRLEMARDRVLSVALLHRRLWQSDDLQTIDLSNFFAELVDGLLSSWDKEWQNQFAVDVEPLEVPAHQALLVALIVNELLTNAVKHAYGGETGPLYLTAKAAGESQIEIVIADKGVGPGGGSREGSFGSRLVERLVKSVGGRLEVTSNNPGASFKLVVPRQPEPRSA